MWPTSVTYRRSTNAAEQQAARLVTLPRRSQHQASIDATRSEDLDLRRGHGVRGALAPRRRLPRGQVPVRRTEHNNVGARIDEAARNEGRHDGADSTDCAALANLVKV